jgi:WD40 repeat protein
MIARIAWIIGFGIVMSSANTARAEGPPVMVWKKHAHSHRVNSVVFSPDGTMLASGSSDRLIHLHRVSDGALLKTFNSDAERIQHNAIISLSYSPDGTRIASASYGKVEIWDVASGELLHTLTQHTDWVLSVAYSPDGERLASGSFDKRILLWNTSDWSVRKIFHHDGQVRTVSYSPDNLHLATGAGDSWVRIWHVPDGPMHHTWSGHHADVQCLAFSPNGLRVASGGQDTTVRIWNILNNQLLQTMTNHTAFVYDVKFSPDGANVASCAGDNTIKIWRVSDGQLIRNLTEETNEVIALAYSKDGLLAYGRVDGRVILACLDCFEVRNPAFSGTDLQFRVIGPPGKNFWLQSSPDLVSWTSVATNALSQAPATYSMPTSAQQRFFRVKKPD